MANINPPAQDPAAAAPAEKAYYCRSQPGQPITVKHIATTASVSYPSTWFNLNRNAKPSIIIKIKLENDAVNTSLVEVRNSLYRGILGSRPALNEAMAFLYLKLLTITDELSDTWQSYNRVIGAQGTRISPLALADIALRHDPMENLQVGPDIAPEQDLFIMTYITSIYRYARANSPEYKTQLSNQIRNFLRGLPGADGRTTTFMYPGAATIGRGWENCKNFCKLMCIIDMFFIKFPNNEYSKVRFGTQASRHKDCAALTLFMTTHIQLGLQNASEMLKWLFTEDLERDAITMFLQTEEYDDNNSYFPYQVDLELVTKSAYSTVACPSIYFLCSSILAINNNTRGLHARFTLQKNVNNVLCNAKLIAYAFTTTSDLEIELNILDRPTSKDPSDWLVYYKSSEAARSAIDNFVRTRLNQNQALRPNSVGMYIRNTTTEI